MFDFHRCTLSKTRPIKVNNSDFQHDLANNRILFEEYGYYERQIIKHMPAFSMAIEQNIFGIYLIPVRIKQKTYRFIIDTGASISGLLKINMRNMDMAKLGSLPIQSAGGSVNEVGVFQIKQMFVGGLEIVNQPVAQMDEAAFSLFGLKKQFLNFDGIIGWDILKELDFSIDSHHLTFNLLNDNPPESCRNLVDVSIPGVLVHDELGALTLLGIDSGARICWFDEGNIVKQVSGPLKKRFTIQMGVLGLEKMQIKIIKRLGYRLFDQKIVLTNTRTGITLRYDDKWLNGILGNEIFEDKTIAFYNSKEFIRIS